MNFILMINQLLLSMEIIPILNILVNNFLKFSNSMLNLLKFVGKTSKNVISRLKTKLLLKLTKKIQNNPKINLSSKCNLLVEVSLIKLKLNIEI
jgi:hypothetical protein